MRSRNYAMTILLALLLFPASGFGQGKTNGNFPLLYKAQIGTTELTPGDYTAQWEGTGDHVTVKVLQHGKLMATATAKVVENAKPAPYNAVTYDTGENTQIVQEIKFAHRKQSLDFTGTQSQTSAK